MHVLKSFVLGGILMLKKYTCLNVELYEITSDEDYINGIMLLPLIGAAMGFFASFISSFRLFYDGYFVSIMVLAYYCIITKTVNLLDTYRTLNFITKPETGTEELTGTIGVSIICLLYISLIKLVNVNALIVMAAAGYSGLIILSAVFQRNKDATTIMKHCGNHHIAAAFIISFCIAVLIDYRLVVPLSLTYMISGLVVNALDKKIKIMPVSAEGFIVEGIQILFLIITYVFKIV